MPQPYPNPNITSFTGFWEYVDLVTSHLALPLLCLVASVIVFIVMMRSDKYEMPAALLGSSTMGLIFSAFLWAAGTLQGKIVVIFLLVVIGSGILNELTRN